METNDWAKLQEELLKVQLGVIRNYLRSVEPGEHERKSSQSISLSHIRVITDVLSAAGSPLRVSEIIRLVDHVRSINNFIRLAASGAILVSGIMPSKGK